ncbi:Alpha-(1,3)-fucosyltransferase C [Orchesella cincta]|uniref:Fucosyltransferase n=1 Tax=Orchesella cincta TaxID=48709 RepID=A0A1D2N6H9_ORCCI|nr:Alpha-(1,3)-fucosyltransferase C [Orchesella cincta]
MSKNKSVPGMMRKFTRRRFSRKFCTLFFLCNAFFIGVIFISSYHTTNRLKRLTPILKKGISGLHNTLKNPLISHVEKIGENERIILFWTTYFWGDQREAWDKPNVTLAYPSCFTNCRIVTDRSYLGVSDAVIFHSRDLRLDDLPKVHPQNQIWVYLQQESPLYTHENLKDYSGIFNWTMSYRRDSDIYHPYKRIHSINSKDKTNESYNFNEIMKPKKKLVAWIVSNCQTEGKREDYVEELEKFISVDIYGSCGDFSCGQKGEACFEDIGQEYKFYLSFENSLCVDYITEKFYNALQYNLVPVVYGGGEYKSIAPPNSYINVNEYSSPMALAKYLIYLDKNPKAYLKYFEWKSKFKVHPGDGWCKLCSQLAIKQKQISDRKVHMKLWKWWKYADYKETEVSQTEKADENERLSLEDSIPWTYIGWHDKDYNISLLKAKTRDNNEVIILHWTRIFREYYESPRILTGDKCLYTHPSNELSSKFSQCRITFDRRYMERSDALVFHSFDLMTEDVPKKRSREQLWVYLQQECPIYTKLNLQAYPDTFNWTMTYRRDSDIYHPYGHIEKISTEGEDQNHDNIEETVKFQNKTRLAAWIVSSCDSYSKRENLVHELQKYIQVDVFGWCGQDCPQHGDCYAHIANTYKFYLSFENSLCTDYITEKFFSAMKQNLVPVVYGGTGAEDYSLIAPTDSYIDARNFETPKDLADFLLFLNKNEQEYLKYFRWKSTSKVVSGQGWCNICQKVFERVQIPMQKRNYKWYKDLWKWWNYMSYDTSIEVDESIQANVIGGPSYNYKLGTPACQPPSQSFVKSSDGGKPDFEPGFLNGRVYGKVGKWAFNHIFGT